MHTDIIITKLPTFLSEFKNKFALYTEKSLWNLSSITVFKFEANFHTLVNLASILLNLDKNVNNFGMLLSQSLDIF